MGGRNDDGTDLAQGQHDHPPLIAALEDEHHGIVLADAETHQIGGSLITLLLQFTVGRADLVTLVIGPQDGQFLGGFLSPGVHHVVGEIKVLWDDKLQILIVILYRLKMRLLQKSFYHSLVYSTVNAKNFTGLSPTASMPWGFVESK